MGFQRIYISLYTRESFNTNISHQLFDYKIINICEFTVLENNFKWLFCPQKSVLNVRLKTSSIQKNLWYDEFN